MAQRFITRTKKDSAGDILALCSEGNYWSPVTKSTAINEILSGAHEYYVPWPNGTNTKINVVNGAYGPYLRTDKDLTSRNNLDDLPDC